MPKKKTPLDEMMANIRKKANSTTFDESVYSDVTGYIDTGCPALNSIISGSVNGGIPEGRITTISGESASGKSLITAMAIANALKKHEYTMVFYLDSEGGGLKDFLEKEKAPLDRIEHILVQSVEEANIRALDIYDQIEEIQKEDPTLKFLIVLDSFGGLISTKSIKDAVDKEKVAMDMGITARLKNQFMKSLMIPCLKTNCAFINLNHVYDDPACLHPSKIKNMSGGKGVVFASHVIVQTGKSFLNDKKNTEAHYNGNTLKFMTTKNRIVKPFYMTEMFIDFNTGTHKYDGLVEEAKKHGFIKHEKGSQWYLVPSFSDKKFQFVDIVNNDEMWNTFLDDLDEKIRADMAYGSKNEIDELDEFKDVTLEGETEG